MANDMQVADSAVDDSDSGQMDTSNGYCIEIRVDAQGQVSVGVEPISAEDGEGSDESQDQYQQVSSFGAAMRLAKEIYAHAGNTEDMAASQAQMMQGYNQ